MYVDAPVFNPITLKYEHSNMLGDVYSEVGNPAYTWIVGKENNEQEMNNMDDNATWTFVRGWEDRYEVSDDGRVFSMLKHKELNQYDNEGYKYVQLCRDYEVYNVGVHRLVAENFLSETPLGDLVVHHIDKDRSNNHVDNLAIMTASAHMKYHMEGKESGKKKAVRVYNGETGEFIKECESLTEAADYIKGNVGEISRAIKCGYQARGYRFTFSDELECRNQKGEIVAEKNTEKEHKTIIKVYDENDMYVGEYYSLREVGDVIGKSGEAVRVAINKNRPCGGYTFNKIK